MDRDDALDYRMLYTKAIAEIERLRAAIREIQFDRGEDRNAVIEECAQTLERCKYGLASAYGEGEVMNWQLKSAAQYYILSDWSMPTKADYEWAEALALAMDRFARAWVKDNCAGRAIRALKEEK